MNKTLNYVSLGVQALALVLIGFLFFGGSSTKLGGTTNYDQLDTTDGYSVDGTSVINGSGVWTGAISSANTVALTGTFSVANTFTLGSGGTVNTKDICATTSISVGSLVSNATGTFSMALPGATSSLNQSYYGGIATSGAQMVDLSFFPSSTTGYVQATVQNLGGTWSGATSTYSACYRQF